MKIAGFFLCLSNSNVLNLKINIKTINTYSLSSNFDSEMRALVFFISLFSVMLWANFSQAATIVPSKTISHSIFSAANQLHASDANSLWTIDEDIDVNEEIPADKIKEKVPAKIFTGFSSFSGIWQEINNNSYQYENRSHYPIVPFSCGSSTPIYISHCVFRI